MEFKLNSAGVRELMQSGEMQEVLSAAAARVASSAGEGYAADVQVGKNRASARISAVTAEARRENLRNNTLLKALGREKI